MAKAGISQDYTKGGAPPAFRPTIRGTRHMVSAGHYLAAEAGFQILEAGGNAVDAGVAAGIALGVVQSEFVNVAGVAPIILYLAERNEVLTISGLGTWPRAALLELFLEQHGGTIPAGLLRTVVPAAPDAWITALAEFGTMCFGDVAEAAIRFARDGVPVNSLMAELIANSAEGYRRWPSSAEVYLPEGRAPGRGALRASRSRAHLAVHGGRGESRREGRARGRPESGPSRLLPGRHRRRHCRLSPRARRAPAMDDMREFHVAIEPPVETTFSETTIYGCGPWCQGPMFLEMPNLVEGIDLAGLEHNSPAYVHALTEAMKLAFADRERYFGDPQFIDVPIPGLLSKTYAAERRQRIDFERAHPEMPPPGKPDAAAKAEQMAGVFTPTGAPIEAALDTSYVSVVDRHGNAFSATPSDSSANTPVIPGTGLCPSSRGYQSWAVPGHPSAVPPGKRPRLTPNPALAMAEGKFVMPFGTPGSDVQCQAMLQVFLNLMVFGMEPQAAVEAPRFATYSFPESGEPHTYRPGQLYLEGRIDDATGETLEQLGHKVSWWPDLVWRAGGLCLIHADRQSGMLSGGTDPRRMGYAIGW